MSLTEKYDRLAEGFSEREYADPSAYSARCARVIFECSPGLHAGASVLDLACGDGLMAGPLAARGLRYTGIDASVRMIEAARTRNPELTFLVGRIEAFTPPEPVETAILLRTFYAVEDRLAFLRHVAGYTRGTFIFDFRRPVFADHEPIVRDLRAAGFSSVELRPFFLPQQRRLPSLVMPLLDGFEKTGPLARLVTRRVGRLFCVASRRLPGEPPARRAPRRGRRD